jgi:plastocyanin
MYRPTHDNKKHSSHPRHLRRWRTALIVGILAINATLAAFAFATTPSSATATATVTIGDTLQPATLTVAPGTVVVFQNTDDDKHRMRSHSGPARFDTGKIRPGRSVSITLTQEGVYQYADHWRGRRHGDDDDDDSEHGDHHGHHASQSYAGTITVTSSAPPPTGGGGSTPPPVTAPATASVAMAGSAFGPRSVTIAVGGTVTWNNNDDRPHTVTASDVSFDSGILARGATFQRTFTTAGTFSYVCDLHSGMTGTVTVVGVSGGTPPPTTPPPASTPPPATTPPPASTPPPVTAPPSGALPTLVQASMAGSQFAPRTITVAVGGTVKWINNDTMPHTVTASDKGFDSDMIAKGAAFERTFPVAGTYAYVCTYHDGMNGTVVVATDTAAAAAAATAAATTKTSATATKKVTKKVTTKTTKKAAKKTVKKVGTTSTAPTAAAAPASANVSMKGSKFGPVTVTIRPGGKVTWVNDDTAPHTVTASDASFDSDMLATGARYERTFTAPGTYSYKCTYHPGMEGKVIVAATAAPAAAKASTPRIATPAAGTSSSSAAPATPAHDTGNAAPAATSKSAGPSKASVTMGDNTFTPANLTIASGTTVTFTNAGKAPHTVTAADKSFDSKMVMPGGKWSMTFTKLGTFKYDCILHPGMTGSVTVEKASAAAVATGGSGGDSAAATPAPSQPAEGTTAQGTTQPGMAHQGTAQSANSYRGVVLLVSGVVLAGGLLYMLGMLIVEDRRWRAAAQQVVRFAAQLGRRFATHIAHPLHPRAVRRIAHH